MVEKHAATYWPELVQKAEDDLSAMTEDRDRWKQMAEQFGETASEFMGLYNAKATEIMKNECEACKEMAPALADKATSERDAANKRDEDGALIVAGALTRAEKAERLCAAWRRAWVAIVGPGPADLRHADERVAAMVDESDTDLSDVTDLREQFNKAFMRAEKAESERDEARQMYCRARARVFDSTMTDPHAINAMAYKVAVSRWPTEADRLFPDGGVK